MKKLLALLCMITVPFAVSAIGCSSGASYDQAQVQPRPPEPRPPKPAPEPPAPRPGPTNTGDPAPDAVPHH